MDTPPNPTTEAILADFDSWRGLCPTTPGVMYACCPTDITCEALVSPYDLYISKASSQTRCAFCMVEEIDTHFCPHDLDNYPSHEAMKNQHRSSKIAECPVCQTRLKVVSDPVSTEHYFECSWCWWNSKELGIVGAGTDAVIKELQKKEKEGDLDQEMKRLITQFSKAAVEAATAAADAQKQRRGLAFMGTLASQPKPPKKTIDEISKEWDAKQHELGYTGPRQQAMVSPVKAPLAAGNIDAVPLNATSSLVQRLRQPESQDCELSSLFPRRAALLTKRSKRCPVTNSLVVKPELNPSKASFQKKTDALQYVPKITVLHPRKADMVLLRFTNPMDHVVTFTLTQWLRPGDTEQEKPFLFKIPEICTTIGSMEELPLLQDKVKPLSEEDDPSIIHSRTTNSVVIRLQSAPVSTPLIQLRLKVMLKVEEEELDEITFCSIVNVPLTECS